MAQLPRLSIVIPTRNRAGYLKRGLDRLSECDYPNLEIIVVDGASTDGTVDLLRSYREGVLKWISEPDRGEPDAFNKGISISTGDYINHFTDDDVIIPSALRAIGDFARARPEIEIIFGQVNLWREIEGRPVQFGVTAYLEPHRVRPSQYFRWPGPPTQGAFVRHSLYERIGLYAEDYVAADYEFWARAIKSKARCALVRTVVANYHFTGGNTVLRRAAEIRREQLRIVEIHGTAADRLFVRLQLQEDLPTAVLKRISHRLGLHPFRWLAEWHRRNTR